MSGEARERIQKLLVTGDNRLKQGVEPEKVRQSYEQALEAARRIRLERPTACILILTGSSISADVDRARQAGVAGFLTKDRLGTQLVDAILELGLK